MLLFEAEGQPGLVPDINFSDSVENLQFDLDFNNILTNDAFALKTPQSTTLNDWKPGAGSSKFSFSNLEDLAAHFATPATPSTFNGSAQVKDEQDALLSNLNNQTILKFVQPTSVPLSSSTPSPSSTIATNIRGKRERKLSARAHAAQQDNMEKLAAAAVHKTAGTKLAGKAATTTTRGGTSKALSRIARAASPVLDTHGLLPDDHRPARGRGRQNQLAKMTAEQIEAEAGARLEKNRQAARDCRLRRKQYTMVLEDKVAQLEKDKRAQDKLIKSLQAQLQAATN